MSCQATAELSTVFEQPTIRPTPNQMASLIRRGLSDVEIGDAWLGHGAYQTMTTTLAETDNLLPKMHRINDTLADEDTGSMYVFAGRDAETLYDDFAIRHHDKPSVLLPASMNLWRCRNMRKTDMVRGFLGTYGVSREIALDPSIDFTFIDSGFDGNAGLAFRRALHTAYGIDNDARVPIKLVKANPRGAGTTIAYFPDIDDADKLFPRTRRISCSRSMMPEAAVAMALQLQPRYHGAYKNLKRQPDGTVLAIPQKERLYDTDTAAMLIGALGRMSFEWPQKGTNVSVVHPLAAAKVQRRVVHAAMLRASNR